jgi:hypothetical protein
MSRYKKILGVTDSTQNAPAMGIIPQLETDMYIPYHSHDRLDVMSYRIYRDPQYWWVILAANAYQIEFDIVEGEILRIPYPLSSALAAIKDNTKDG